MLLDRLMKITLATVFVFLCLFAFEKAYGAQRGIEVQWEYTADTPDLAGFYLYADGAKVCTFPADTRVAECSLDLGESATSFTMAAYDQGGNEGASSAPFVLDPPPAGTPLILKVVFK